LLGLMAPHRCPLVNAFSASPVPLPGAAVLMGTALAGFAGSRGGADVVVNLPRSPLRRTVRPIAPKNLAPLKSRVLHFPAGIAPSTSGPHI
jgi:hypothetical protein